MKKILTAVTVLSLAGALSLQAQGGKGGRPAVHKSRPVAVKPAPPRKAVAVKPAPPRKAVVVKPAPPPPRRPLPPPPPRRRPWWKFW